MNKPHKRSFGKIFTVPFTQRDGFWRAPSASVRRQRPDCAVAVCWSSALRLRESGGGRSPGRWRDWLRIPACAKRLGVRRQSAAATALSSCDLSRRLICKLGVCLRQSERLHASTLQRFNASTLYLSRAQIITMLVVTLPPMLNVRKRSTPRTWCSPADSVSWR